LPSNVDVIPQHGHSVHFFEARLPDTSTSLDRQETRMAEMRSLLEEVNGNIQHLLANDTTRPGLVSDRKTFVEHLQRGILSAESWVANASSSASTDGSKAPWGAAAGDSTSRRKKVGSKLDSQTNGVTFDLLPRLIYTFRLGRRLCFSARLSNNSKLAK
jgi:hypothetical protein